MRIVEIADADIEPVVELWDLCGLTRPWNDPRADIALARRTEGASVLVGWIDDAIAATVMVGSDGHRGWVYYLAVEPDLQRAGLGRKMMAAAESWLRGRGVPKIQLMVRDDNARVRGFYRDLGYEPQAVVVMGKRF